MALKRQSKSDKLAGEVELAAFMIDNEADQIPEDMPATDMTCISIEFDPGTLPLNVFLHAMAAKMREMADEVRKLK